MAYGTRRFNAAFTWLSGTTTTITTAIANNNNKKKKKRKKKKKSSPEWTLGRGKSRKFVRRTKLHPYT